MQADCGILEGACDTCVLHNKVFMGEPVSVKDLPERLIDSLGMDAVVYGINGSVIATYVHSLSNNMSDYLYVATGVYANRIVHKTGLLDRKNKFCFCSRGYSLCTGLAGVTPGDDSGGPEETVIDEDFDDVPSFDNGWAMFRLTAPWVKSEDGGIVTKDGGCYPETDYMLHHAYYPVTLDRNSICRMGDSLDALMEFDVGVGGGSMAAILLYFRV